MPDQSTQSAPLGTLYPFDPLVQLHVNYCPCLHLGEYVSYTPVGGTTPDCFEITKIYGYSIFEIRQHNDRSVIYRVFGEFLTKQTFSTVTHLPLSTGTDYMRYIRHPLHCGINVESGMLFQRPTYVNGVLIERSTSGFQSSTGTAV